MKLRKLNEQGVEVFRDYINDLRSGADQNIPNYLLDSDEYSEDIQFELEITKPEFKSRLEMGVYLVDLFDGLNITPYIGDIGFWSWLALYWFEQLCSEKEGKLNPSMDYNYILSKNFRHRPRHAVYMTWQLVTRYGEDCAFMLCKAMSTRGELTEQMMARQENLSSESVMKLANALYFDSETRTFKKGAAARKSAGCVARYITWLEQIKMTYDVFSISADELKDLLPAEFDRFMEA
jgi:hypothetical protein